MLYGLGPAHLWLWSWGWQQWMVWHPHVPQLALKQKQQLVSLMTPRSMTPAWRPWCQYSWWLVPLMVQPLGTGKVWTWSTVAHRACKKLPLEYITRTINLQSSPPPELLHSSSREAAGTLLYGWILYLKGNLIFYKIIYYLQHSSRFSQLSVGITQLETSPNPHSVPSMARMNYMWKEVFIHGSPF